MNKKHLAVLADWLERGAPHAHIHFNMCTYLTPIDKDGNDLPYFSPVEDICSTACCMAGALVQTYAPEKLVTDGRISYISPISEVAARLAGLPSPQAFQLFIPPNIPLASITAQKAAKVVRHLIATGTVDWRVAGYENRF